MKIYVVTTGENEITVSLNGEAPVTKTVKPTLTALGNGRIQFQCDDIDEEVETYRYIFINAVPLKGSWVAEEDWLSVALFDSVMNKTFVSSGSPGSTSYLVAEVELTDAQIKALPTTPIEIIAAQAGKMYQVLAVNAIMNIVSNGSYTVDGNIINVVMNDGTVDVSLFEGGLTALQESTGTWGILFDKGDSSLYGLFGNKNVRLDTDSTTDYTGGNAANTLKVTVYYVIVDL